MYNTNEMHSYLYVEIYYIIWEQSQNKKKTEKKNKTKTKQKKNKINYAIHVGFE